MAAGDEQHRDWSDARNEERIMIGAAHHGEKTHAMLSARLSQRIDYFWRGVYRRGCSPQFRVNRDPAFVSNCTAYRFHLFHPPVAPPGVRAADAPAQADTAGNGTAAGRQKRG